MDVFTSAKKILIAKELKVEGIKKAYYGMNISKGREPIDQIDFLFLIKQMDIPVNVFIAGKYGVLNNGKKPVEYFIEKERYKKELYLKLFENFGIGGKVTLTDRLWSNPIYWESILEFKNLDGIIDKSSGAPLNSFDSSIFGIGQDCMNPYLEVMKEIGGIPASSIYTLFEVAEARTLQKTEGIDCKMGPESEERYDQYIKTFMSIIQLYQPLDIKSSEIDVKQVIPYMERLEENRIFFEDSKEEVLNKISKMAQRAEKTSLFWKSKNGWLLNPFCRMVIYAFESAEIRKNLPILLRGRPIYSSSEAIEFIYKSGASGLINIASPIAEAIWNYIILPIKSWEK